MKKLLILLLAVLSAYVARAQVEVNLDEEFFSLPEEVTDAYLDSISVQKTAVNNYWMVGAFGGAAFQYGYFNPVRYVLWQVQYPVYGFSFIRYFTMFGKFPNMGLEIGAQQDYEGYEFKRIKETGSIFTESGAYKAMMSVPEAFMLSHFHFDIGDHFKLMAKVGIYGGYRRSITRIPEESYAQSKTFLEHEHSFQDYDRRWTYGLKGGLGFGVMFDPFEIHAILHIKWGWGSFWDPDYTSPYYYRFGYPLDSGLTIGIYYQLTPRHGHSRSQLRKMAKRIVEQEYNQQNYEDTSR